MKKKRGEPAGESNFIEVDEHQLDYECTRQAKLYMDWALKLADAQFSVDEAEAQMDLCEVEIARHVRMHPTSYELTKVTDKAVAETVTMSKQYQRKLEILNVRKRKVGRIKAVVTALDHRKKMIEALVYLRGQMYFAEPKTEGGGRVSRLKSGH